jgi:hypothetical protein
MILGATAFSILIYNESTENSLANGTVMPTEWYHTLHWVDTVIFIFAIIYVLAACWMLNLLCEQMTTWLASIDYETASDVVTDMKGKKRRSMQAKIESKHARQADPDLVDAVREDLATHVASTDKPLHLPDTVMDTILHALGDSDQAGMEQTIREFLCEGDDTETEVVLETNPRRHMYLLLQPLVDLKVVTTEKTVVGKTKTTVLITKLPAEGWRLANSHLSAASEDGIEEAAERASRMTSGGNKAICYYAVNNPKSDLPSFVPVEKLTRWQKFRITKHMQYLLVKDHFVKTFFDAEVKLDFVFYIEICMIFGITNSFNIGVGEWLVLLFACIPVVKGVGHLESFEVFTICCMIALLLSVTVTFILWNFFYQVILEDKHFNVKNPNDMTELSRELLLMPPSPKDRSGSVQHLKQQLDGKDDAIKHLARASGSQQDLLPHGPPATKQEDARSKRSHSTR